MAKTKFDYSSYPFSAFCHGLSIFKPAYDLKELLEERQKLLIQRAEYEGKTVQEIDWSFLPEINHQLMMIDKLIDRMNMHEAVIRYETARTPFFYQGQLDADPEALRAFRVAVLEEQANQDRVNDLRR